MIRLFIILYLSAFLAACDGTTGITEIDGEKEKDTFWCKFYNSCPKGE